MKISFKYLYMIASENHAAEMMMQVMRAPIESKGKIRPKRLVLFATLLSSSIVIDLADLPQNCRGSSLRIFGLFRSGKTWKFRDGFRGEARNEMKSIEKRSQAEKNGGIIPMIGSVQINPKSN